MTAIERPAESISGKVHQPPEDLTAVDPPADRERPDHGSGGIWGRWRERHIVARLLEFLRALDDDPVLMCGCPAGMPCGDPVAGRSS